jgi:tetratricopeptide (TPR) repeat protein
MSEIHADQGMNLPQAPSSAGLKRFKPSGAFAALVIGALILSGLWFWNNRLRPQWLVTSGTEMLHPGKLDEAIAAFREAIRLNPGYAPAHSALGDALSLRAKRDEAIGEYRTAIRLDPDSDVAKKARHAIGTNLRKQGKLEEAIAAYKEAVAGGALSEDVYIELSDAEQAQRNVSEAMAEYLDAVRSKPTEFAVHKNLLGVVLRYEGKLSESVAALREAIRLRPDFADAHLNLARTLVSQDEPIAAIIEFREAIRLDPAHAAAQKDLQTALGHLGNLGEVIGK